MSNNSKIHTINPATEQVVGTFDVMDSAQISQIVKKSRIAFDLWRKKEITERCDYIRNLVKVLRKNKDSYSTLVTQEMGKPIRQSVAEIDKCEWLCDYYAEHAESFLRDEIIPTEFRKSFVSFEPLGVIAGIMPWNFPFWQVMRYAVPALIAGNVGVLKHSSVCLGSALEIEKAFQLAGFPDGVFQSIIGDYRAGEALIQAPGVDAVSVTGSVETGRRIGELASKGLKKYVLELGGSDPFIVLEDADLIQTAHLAAQSRLLNTGQSCIAAKRFIVVRDVAEKFLRLFVENTKSEVVGDPMNPKTTVGPLVRDTQRLALEKQVDDAKTRGAEILTGGKRVQGNGYFYEPTVLSNVTPEMAVLREEVFGPAAPVMIVKNESEAVQEANNSEFGLGASIWTNDLEKGVRLARQIQSGIVRVNEMVRSDPRLPFGGVKYSGIGRELSEFGIKEFVNIKSVAVKDLASKILVE